MLAMMATRRRPLSSFKCLRPFSRSVVASVMGTSSTIHHVTHELLKQSQCGFDESNRQTCLELLQRLVESSATPSDETRPAKTKRKKIDAATKTMILRTLTTASKSFRRYKRSNPEWKAVLDQITDFVKELESAKEADAHDDHNDDVDQNPQKDVKASSSGLPASVSEYLSRLQRQKKELYKNPPVLPPHAVVVEQRHYPLPVRNNSDRTLQFVPGQQSDASTVEFIRQFCPNLTPEEILRGGAFGGTYFRTIESSVTNQRYAAQQVLETTIPTEWIQGLDRKVMLISSTYRAHVNKYGVKCGGSLGMWESSGWISDVDPYGWFQWYCRFYQGRRCSDDGRQISRWLGVAGARGRFRSQLCNKILSTNRPEAWKDASISPVIRQTLFHWGLEVTKSIVEQHSKAQRG